MKNYLLLLLLLFPLLSYSQESGFYLTNSQMTELTNELGMLKNSQENLQKVNDKLKKRLEISAKPQQELTKLVEELQNKIDELRNSINQLEIQLAQSTLDLSSLTTELTGLKKSYKMQKTMTIVNSVIFPFVGGLVGYGICEGVHRIKQ